MCHRAGECDPVLEICNDPASANEDITCSYHSAGCPHPLADDIYECVKWSCSEEVVLSGTGLVVDTPMGSGSLAGTYMRRGIEERGLYSQIGAETEFLLFFTGEAWEINWTQDTTKQTWTLKQQTQHVCPSSAGGNWVYTDLGAKTGPYTGSILDMSLDSKTDPCDTTTCDAGTVCYAIPGTVLAECVPHTDPCDSR